MKKSSKRLRLSSEAMNSKKFRVRTEGIRLDAYRDNPLLIFEHNFPVKASKDAILPLGVGMDIIKENGELYVTPAFDPTDAFAEQIYNKVENGTIRMASAGLNPIEWRTVNGELWLWESELVEATITLKGANPESFAVALYDESRSLINLTEDFLKSINTEEMKTIQLNASVLPLVKLAEGSTPEQVQEAIQNLVTLSETQATQIQQLSAAKETAEADKAAAELAKKTAEDALTAERLVTLHATEVVQNRKVTEDSWNELVKLGYDAAKAVLATMKANPTVEKQLEQQSAGGELDTLVKLSWDELDKTGKLKELKEKNVTVFEQKYKEKFGKEYQK